MAKVRAFDCAWIKCVEYLPFVTEDLNLVKIRITDVNIAPVVYSQSGAAICIAQIHGAQEMAPCIENLNARVAYIEHEQFTTGYDYLAGEPELTGAVTAATVAELANQLPPLVHNKDHVPLPIAHVNASRSFIDCDPCWAIEVRFSASHFPEVTAKLSCRIVDQYRSSVLVDDVEVILTVHGERDGKVQTIAASVQTAIFRANKVEDMHGLSAGIGDEDTVVRVCGHSNW